MRKSGTEGGGEGARDIGGDIVLGWWVNSAWREGSGELRCWFKGRYQATENSHTPKWRYFSQMNPNTLLSKPYILIFILKSLYQLPSPTTHDVHPQYPPRSSHHHIRQTPQRFPVVRPRRAPQRPRGSARAIREEHLPRLRSPDEARCYQQGL